MCVRVCVFMSVGAYVCACLRVEARPRGRATLAEKRKICLCIVNTPVRPHVVWVTWPRLPRFACYVNMQNNNEAEAHCKRSTTPLCSASKNDEAWPMALFHLPILFFILYVLDCRSNYNFVNRRKLNKHTQQKSPKQIRLNSTMIITVHRKANHKCTYIVTAWNCCLLCCNILITFIYN